MFNDKTAKPVSTNSTLSQIRDENIGLKMNKDRILRPKQTKEVVQLSMATMYRLAKDEESTFPKPIKLSEHASGWLESEIYAWLEERIAERDEEGA